MKLISNCKNKIGKFAKKCVLRKHEGLSDIIVAVGLILVAIVLIFLFKDTIYNGIKELLSGVSGEIGTISNWGN